MISFFYDGISTITEPLHDFFFHMVESRLSRSLSRDLFFLRWNLGYHGASSLLFLSHGGISAITKPFIRTFFFHGGISAIMKPFIRTFLFSRWNLGYHEASHMNFSFFTVESRLSRSLSYELFFFTVESRLSWSLSYELFFFHDGISAITKPLIRTFLFSRWNLGYHEAFHSNFSFFTVEYRLSRSLFANFLFSRWNIGYHRASSRRFLSHGGIHKMHDLGEDSFHIYRKEYLHRICLVKNLASWFRVPVGVLDRQPTKGSTRGRWIWPRRDQ
jgi:hypothetical protein